MKERRSMSNSNVKATWEIAASMITMASMQEKDFQQSKDIILCIGLTAVDLITTVEQYPKEDSDERGLSFRKQRGGNASNVSTALRLLQTPCEYLGVLPPPSDPEHRWLKEDFDRLGIQITGCVYSDRPCPIASVLVSRENGSRTIVFCDNGHPELSYQQFVTTVGHRLLTFSWIHVELRPNAGDCANMLKLVREKCAAEGNRLPPAEGLPQSAGPRISVDVEKPDQLNAEEAMALADVIFISKDWARSRGWTDMHSAARHCSKLCRPHATVVCPWAEAGAAAFHEGQLLTSTSVAPGPVVDTLGAGDTFVGAFLHACVHHRTLQQALDFACKIAAFKCTIEGYEGLHRFTQPVVLHDGQI